MRPKSIYIRSALARWFVERFAKRLWLRWVVGDWPPPEAMKYIGLTPPTEDDIRWAKEWAVKIVEERT